MLIPTVIPQPSDAVKSSEPVDSPFERVLASVDLASLREASRQRFAREIDIRCGDCYKSCTPSWDHLSEWYVSSCCADALMQRDQSRDDSAVVYVEADPQDVLRVADDGPYFAMLADRLRTQIAAS